MVGIFNKINISNKIVKFILASTGIMFIVLGLLCLYILGGKDNNNISDEISINNGWMINYGTSNYKDIPLNEKSEVGQVKAGHQVVLVNRMPSDWNYQSPVIKLNTRYSAVKIYINGTPIYENGLDRYNNNQIIGCGNQYIKANDTYKGKVIRIEITPEKDSLFVNLAKISIADATHVYQSQTLEYRVPFVMGIFLCIFGICLALLGLSTFVIYIHMIRLTELGGITLCVGVWTLCKYRLIQLFGVPMNILSIIEVMSLYVGSVFLTLYFRNYVQELNQKKMTLIYRFLLILQILILISKVVAIVLKFNTYALQLHTIYYLFGFEAVYITFLMIILIKKGYKQGIIVLFGFYIMVGVIGIETLNEISRQDIGYIFLRFKGISALGTLIFILVLISAFAIDIARKLKLTTEEEVLYQMAYTDIMTNVYNRRYCEDQLKQLSNQEKEYGIFNFDLNKLKETNDSLGHEYGDRLITLFASSLKKTFSKRGAVCRMGGDEFVVIIENSKKFDKKEYINELMINIDELNNQQNNEKNKLLISTSYGYADSNEVERVDGKVDAKLVYSLSDTRMYQYKQRFE